MTRFTNPMSIIERKGMKFLIHDAPSNSNIHAYIKAYKRHNVTHVVRACSPTYNREAVERHNIQLHELNFDDGKVPPQIVVKAWLELVNKVFPKNTTSTTPNQCIAVHCVAGLGRAPVLVAIALIELDGMNQLDAVEFIRGKRRGAFNERQITYLEKYKPKSKTKNACVIC
jgi:protein tyrosine phosphatase type 4A